MATDPAARGEWGTQFGFVMAAVGSAVGLGNMWRFPYQMAEAGGAAFLMLYILLVVLIGIPIMLAEFSVGRGSKQSPLNALEHFGGKAWRPLGFLFVASGFLILSYYGVIAGWVVRYAAAYLSTGFIVDPGATFEAWAAGPEAVALQVLFMAITIGIVMGGVKGGIERAAVVLMPLLFLIVLGLALYAAVLPGAGGGYSYYFQTDFSEIFSLGTFSSAAGQAFFSLSLGMGAMLTYSSYLSRSDDLPREACVIAGCDFMVAFVAGLMIFPLIFALGLQGMIVDAEEPIGTVGALFIALPQAFGEMGGLTGRLLGALFFTALLVGALTSAISLLEVVVSSAIDTLRWSRVRASLILGGAITIIGIPAALPPGTLNLEGLGLTYLGFVDKLAGEVFLVVGALLIAIFVGWRMANPIAEVERGSRMPGVLPSWKILLKWVVPPLLLIVLFFQLSEFIELIRGLLGGPS